MGIKILHWLIVLCVGVPMVAGLLMLGLILIKLLFLEK